jgi:NADPH:quinone reductase-like Zn-dependent oxidoreductase
MKGITVASAGAEWKLVEDLVVPEPADDQILVKSVYTAINPV